MTLNTPNLIVISAPSGAGKTTICNKILKKHPNIFYSISYTTRKPRNGEVDKKDYFFIDKNEFKKKIEEKKWAEWALVYDNYYGTSIDYLNEKLSKKQIILIDIDIQGAKQIFKKYNNSTSIFIMPPSIETLKDRLINRKSDTIAEIEKRLSKAKKEIKHKSFYKHIIINYKLDDAIKEFEKILKTEKLIY